MNKHIQIYYIPNNPNILKGHIYTLYINNNTNLDLTSIINIKNITTSNKVISKDKDIFIQKNDYIKLLELNNKAHQLITELTKINIERQEIIKGLTGKKEIIQ